MSPIIIAILLLCICTGPNDEIRDTDFFYVRQYLYWLRPLVEWVAHPFGRGECFDPLEFIERLRPHLNEFRRRHADLMTLLAPWKKKIADKLGLQKFMVDPYVRTMAHDRV